MSDQRNNSTVGGVSDESDLVWGEWAGTGGVGWGGRNQETPFWSYPDATTLSQPKDEHGARHF